MLPSSTLAAQTHPASRFALGFSVGPAFTNGSVGQSPLGPAGSVSVQWSATRRLALTVEALASRFSRYTGDHSAPCPLDTGPEGCGSPRGPLGVGALIAGVQWLDSTVALREKGSYLTLGGGLYHALDHPTARGTTRLGWTAGFGFVLDPGTPRVSLEIRYHQIPRWPERRVAILPITLAFSW
jgi:hypothetical protein